VHEERSVTQSKPEETFPVLWLFSFPVDARSVFAWPVVAWSVVAWAEAASGFACSLAASFLFSVFKLALVHAVAGLDLNRCR